MSMNKDDVSKINKHDLNNIKTTKDEEAHLLNITLSLEEDEKKGFNGDNYEYFKNSVNRISQDNSECNSEKVMQAQPLNDCEFDDYFKN